MVKTDGVLRQLRTRLAGGDGVRGGGLLFVSVSLLESRTRLTCPPPRAGFGRYHRLIVGFDFYRGQYSNEAETRVRHTGQNHWRRWFGCCYFVSLRHLVITDKSKNLQGTTLKSTVVGS